MTICAHTSRHRPLPGGPFCFTPNRLGMSKAGTSLAAVATREEAAPSGAGSTSTTLFASIFPRTQNLLSVASLRFRPPFVRPTLICSS